MFVLCFILLNNRINGGSFIVDFSVSFSGLLWARDQFSCTNIPLVLQFKSQKLNPL